MTELQLQEAIAEQYSRIGWNADAGSVYLERGWALWGHGEWDWGPTTVLDMPQFLAALKRLPVGCDPCTAPLPAGCEEPQGSAWPSPLPPPPDPLPNPPLPLASLPESELWQLADEGLKRLGWDQDQEAVYLRRACGCPHRASGVAEVANLVLHVAALRQLLPPVSPKDARLPTAFNPPLDLGEEAASPPPAVASPPIAAGAGQGASPAVPAPPPPPPPGDAMPIPVEAIPVVPPAANDQALLARHGFHVPAEGDYSFADLLGRPAAVQLPNGGIYWRPNQLKPGTVPLTATDADVAAFPAVWFESDTLTLAQQLGLIEGGFPIAPSAALHTGGKSIHCYWLLKEPVPNTADNRRRWQRIERGLAVVFHGDAQVVNPSRLMRFPYSCHQKTGEPGRLWLHPNQPRFTLEELDAAYGIDAPAAKEAPLRARPVPRVTGDRREAFQRFAAAVEACCPRGGAGTDTFGIQRKFTWSAMEYAAEQQFPIASVKQVLVNVMGIDRPKEAPRLVASWERGKHSAGYFLVVVRQAGYLKPKRRAPC